MNFIRGVNRTGFRSFLNFISDLFYQEEESIVDHYKRMMNAPSDLDLKKIEQNRRAIIQAQKRLLSINVNAKKKRIGIKLV